jgi:hypothetical protein
MKEIIFGSVTTIISKKHHKQADCKTVDIREENLGRWSILQLAQPVEVR